MTDDSEVKVARIKNHTDISRFGGGLSLSRLCLDKIGRRLGQTPCAFVKYSIQNDGLFCLQRADGSIGRCH